MIRPEKALDQALCAVTDPEIPVTLRDLGVIRRADLDATTAVITLSPTRLGCPALGEIARRVRRAALTVRGVDAVRLVWRPEQWSPSDITPAGAQALHDAGYSVAEERPGCPHCGSTDVEALSEFGGSLCRRPLLCRGCGTPFDVLRSARCVHPSR
jgi:ring-1,2-phenylacetyl-CoA epoxidase subunit PaaD